MPKKKVITSFIEFFLSVILSKVGAQVSGANPDPETHFVYPPLPGPNVSDDPTVFWNNINLTAGAQPQPFTWVTNMDAVTISMHQQLATENFISRVVTLAGMTG